MLVSEMYGGRVKLLGKFFRHLEDNSVFIFANADYKKYGLIGLNICGLRWNDPIEVDGHGSGGFTQDEASRIFDRDLSEWEEVSPEVAAEYIIESRRKD